MWQRIQTLYLVLVVFLMLAAIILPVAEFYSESSNTSYQLDMRGMVQQNPEGESDGVVGSNPMTFIFGLVLFLASYSITLFKNRRKQMRMATVNFFLLIIYVVAFAIFIYLAKGKLDAEVKLLYPAIFPVIALIFNYLAMRGIAKDEKLVRSLDRLR